MLSEHLAEVSPGGNGPEDLVFVQASGRPIRQGNL
jgi:hypothetical protein